ncbi:MAG TPA: chaperone NapD [Croceibacterium sp.]
MDDEVHIASFVVHHRPDAVHALQRLTAQWPGLELAAHEQARSVLLLECGGTRELLACMDAAQAAAGVVSVNLVYHHAEPHAAIERALSLPD